MGLREVPRTVRLLHLKLEVKLVHVKLLNFFLTPTRELMNQIEDVHHA